MAQQHQLFDGRNGAIPGTEWTEVAPASAGWSTERLRTLAGGLADGRSTALMVIDDGNVVFRWGDVAMKSSVASSSTVACRSTSVSGSTSSICKSPSVVLRSMSPSATYTPQRTLIRLLRNLLKARSGVYLPSVYDTGTGRPKRGTHAPGSHWFYNNWDFNVLGTILESQTGESLFEALARRVAAPLGMQDFEHDDGRYHRGPESRHPVYKLGMTARDLARVGLLYLREGLWGSGHLVPAEWVRESTRPHSNLGGGRGYGYLWWTAAAQAPGDSMSINAPMFYASGFGGQYIVVVPALNLVVVHRAARVDHGISHGRMGEILRLILSAMPDRRQAPTPTRSA